MHVDLTMLGFRKSEYHTDNKTIIHVNKTWRERDLLQAMRNKGRSKQYEERMGSGSIKKRAKALLGPNFFKDWKEKVGR